MLGMILIGRHYVAGYIGNQCWQGGSALMRFCGHLMEHLLSPLYTPPTRPSRPTPPQEW